MKNTRINPFAIVGFVFSVASVPLCMMIAIPISGMALSIVGLATAKRYRPWGRILACIGLVISSLCLLVTILTGR